MANKYYDESNIQDIADAIREKNGETSTYKVSEMGNAIRNISSGGGDIDALIDKSLTEITSNVEKVSDYAFYSSALLASVDLPEATSIGEYAFRDCAALTTINAPKVETISIHAFYKCSSLALINIPEVTSIGKYAFYSCTSLASVDLPEVTGIGTYAFYGCAALTTINAPKVTYLNNRVFYNCSSLESINIPEVATIDSYAFYGCTSLTTVDIPKVTNISGSTVFSNCEKLSKLILRGDSVCTLKYAIFTNTPINSGTGYIYVPSALIDTYKAASNWTTYANQFRALEDYTVDGTTTGELDESKI